MSAKRFCLAPLALRRFYSPPKVKRVWLRDASTSSAPSGASFSSAATFKDDARTQAARALAQAVEQRALPSVRRLYPRVIAALVSRTGETAVLERYLERAVLTDAMRMLAESSASSNADYQLLWRIFEDLERVFAIEPKLDDCACVLAGMISRSAVREAYDWLKALPAVYRVQPTVSEWNMVLSGIQQHFGRSSNEHDPRTTTQLNARVATQPSRASLLQAVYNDMINAGVSPTIDTFNVLLKSFAERGEVQQVESTFEQLSRHGVLPNVQTQTTLLRGYLAGGHNEEARRSADRLMRQHSALDADAWNTLLAFSASTSESTALAQDAEAVISLMKVNGIEPNAQTLCEVVCSDKTPLVDLASAAQVIDHAEDLTGLSIDSQALATVLRRLLDHGNGDDAVTARLSVALSIYNEAVHGGRAVSPTNEVVVPILDAIHSAEQAEQLLDQAKTIYGDTQTAYENGLTSGPSIEVYAALLRICGCNTAGAAWAEQLLLDMKRYQHTMTMSAIIEHASTITRASPNYEAAYRLLLGFHQLDPHLVDSASAESLLQVYLSLPIAEGPAPYEQTTLFLQQMRFASAFFGSSGYSALFRHYAGENASGQPDARAVQRFHTVLNLDRFYEPETVVFNELIRAYAAAGAFDAAWGVWESMLLTPQRALWDEQTIVVVLDVCGAAVGEQVLDPRPVWRLARTREAVDPLFRLSKTAWDTWVGALARIGTARQLDYATDVVTGQMGRAETFREPLEGADLYARGREPPMADASTLDMLLRYAHAKGGRELLAWLRRRLQHQLPELFQVVAHVERFDWDEVRRLREQCRWPDYGMCTH